MDSGNSGSMQSSRGGDEEYDSRFLNNPPPQQNHVGSFSSTSVASNNHLSQHHQDINLFDPLSNYFDPPQKLPPSSLFNLDQIIWLKYGSESNQTNVDSWNQNFVSSQTIAFPQESGGMVSVSGSNDQDHKISTNSNMVRNPKKRSRASRRAPTTVLTTDTTNFRAMVQEFTGIPAPPFTSSPFTRTRLDLFGSVSNTSSITRSSSLDPSPSPFLLRPFAKKNQPIHPFPPSTSSIPSSSTNSLVDHLELLKQQQQVQPLNVNNMHNPIFSFQTQTQTSPRYPLGNSSLIASRTLPSLNIPPNSVESHIKMGVLDELGLNMVPSLSSNEALCRGNNNNNNMSNTSAEWAQRISVITNNDGDHGEKGQDCVVGARSEGMVETWINCSSD